MTCKHDWRPSYTHDDFICTKCGAHHNRVSGKLKKRRHLRPFDRANYMGEPHPPSHRNPLADSSRPPPDKLFDPTAWERSYSGEPGGDTDRHGPHHPSGNDRPSGGRGGLVSLGVIVAVAGIGIWAFATYAVPEIAENIEAASEATIEAIEAIEAADPIIKTVSDLSDTVKGAVENPESVTDAIINLLPDAVGPYVLEADDYTTGLPATPPAASPPKQPSTDTPTTHEQPQTPFDRTIWPSSPDTEPEPTSPNTKLELTFVEQVENHVHEMTNDERTSRGIGHLASDNRLDSIARSHSQDMANRNYFDHDTPEGRDPTDRGMAVGYNCRKDYGSYYTYGLAENIFWISWAGSNPETLAHEIVDSWMGSQGHRQNILEPTYDTLGVGIAISRTGAVYVTQNFC